MKLEYKTEEEDFLSYQLFTTVNSKRFKSVRNKARLIFTVAFAIFSLNMYFKEIMIGSLLFAILAILSLFFYPRLSRWSNKRNFKRNVKENFKNRIGEIQYFELHEDFIFSKDRTGEGKIKISEIEVINEISSHYFLKLLTGQSLIFPKRGIPDEPEFRNHFTNKKIKINSHLNWEW